MSNRLQQHEFVRGRLGMISAKGSRYWWLQ
jgi:hypothetical protein